MGDIVSRDGGVFYRQDDGEITADLTRFSEKMRLDHEGLPLYRRLLPLFVAAAGAYLLWIFLFR